MIDYTLSADCTLTSDAACQRWVHHNRLGSVVAVTDSVGAVEDRFRYSAYGVAGSEGPAGFPFRFTGQKLDPETGLYYYKARYYDPETGRFLQTDPVGYEAGMNLYAYVGNDPLNLVDPTGECGAGWQNTSECIVFIAGAQFRNAKGGNPDLEDWSNDVGGRFYSQRGGEGEIAQDIRDYKATNPNATVTIVGYSRGGQKAIGVANDLGEGDNTTTVDELVLIDPHRIASGRHTLNGDNVTSAVNFYQNNDRTKDGLNSFRGRSVNGIDPQDQHDLTGDQRALHSLMPDYVRNDPNLQQYLPARLWGQP